MISLGQVWSFSTGSESGFRDALPSSDEGSKCPWKQLLSQMGKEPEVCGWQPLLLNCV